MAGTSDTCVHTFPYSRCTGTTKQPLSLYNYLETFFSFADLTEFTVADAVALPVGADAAPEDPARIERARLEGELLLQFNFLRPKIETQSSEQFEF